MIANARMYAVSPDVAALWHGLLSWIISASALPITVVEHAAPAPLEELWRRTDLAAVFMCGLPFSRTQPPPVLIAAPVPSPAEFGGIPRYWSELVVRADGPHQTVADTFGGRIAFTVPGSQSGYAAALSYFMAAGARSPLFDEIIPPTITPLGALYAVIRGEADIAPIDAYSFRLLQQHRPELIAQVRSVGRTDPTPIPPLVASQPGLDALQTAFIEAHESSHTRFLMESLLLQRFSVPDPASYGVLRERFEAAARYWGSRRLAARAHPAFAL